MPPDSSTCDVQAADDVGEHRGSSRGRRRRRGRRGGSSRRRRVASASAASSASRTRSHCPPCPVPGARRGRRPRRRRAAGSAGCRQARSATLAQPADPIVQQRRPGVTAFLRVELRRRKRPVLDGGEERDVVGRPTSASRRVALPLLRGVGVHEIEPGVGVQSREQRGARGRVDGVPAHVRESPGRRAGPPSPATARSRRSPRRTRHRGRTGSACPRTPRAPAGPPTPVRR